MPKNTHTSKKTAVAITEDKSVISLKAQDQPLTEIEKTVLASIYQDVVSRLDEAVRRLSQLEEYYAHKQNPTLFFHAAMEKKALYTLKMIKRHFYIHPEHYDTKDLLHYIRQIKNHVFKTQRGLEGQLDISLSILDKAPNSEDLLHQNKAYILVQTNNSWILSYYEGGLKRNDIPIYQVDPNIQHLTAREAQINYVLILRMIMLYHAHHVFSQKDPVYISDISRKKQQNPNNEDLGYVYYQLLDSKLYYGALHMDYRLLENDPMEAMRTLAHEAFHRYAFVHDRGYYHDTKASKDGLRTRSFSRALEKSTPKAMNNADSYAFFISELTDTHTYLQSDYDCGTSSQAL